MLNYPDFHIFIVDNYSSDQSVENIVAWCARPRAEARSRRFDGVDRWTDNTTPPALAYRIIDSSQLCMSFPSSGCRLTLIRAGGNLGFAGGCNTGIRCAGLTGYDFFWFLNTDTVVHREALSTLVERATSDSEVGMVGSTVCYYDRPSTVQALGGAQWNDSSASSHHIGQGLQVDDIPRDISAVERKLSYVFGASMLVSSKLILAIGSMREDYFLYYEEFDWAMRCRDKFKLGYAAGSIVLHKSGASSSKSMPLFSANYYYRNHVRFVSRFYPQHLNTVKRALVKEFVRYALRGRWLRARLVASILFNADLISDQALASK